jgi:hypothetical protein
VTPTPIPTGIGGERSRFNRATSAIRLNRRIASYSPNPAMRLLDVVREDDETILVNHGYRGIAEYWQVALSRRVMTKSEFVYLLQTHLIDPATAAIIEASGDGCGIQDYLIGIQLLLEAALGTAERDGERWLFLGREQKGKREWLVRPRSAVEALARDPFDRDYLPASLQTYLAAEAGVASPKPHGPKAVEIERVKAAMRQLDRGKLKGMKIVEMEKHFAAKPTTCRRAREEVLAEQRPAEHRT